MKTIQRNSQESKQPSTISQVVSYTTSRPTRSEVSSVSITPLNAFEKLEAPAAESYHASVPIALHTKNRGTMKFLRQRTKGDELAERARKKGQRPTSRAIRMANALMLERLLGTGQFASASDLARRIGIGKHLLSDRLALLNMPVEEIERWLFETY